LPAPKDEKGKTLSRDTLPEFATFPAIRLYHLPNSEVAGGREVMKPHFLKVQEWGFNFGKGGKIL
jgi:hypothetical protein